MVPESSPGKMTVIQVCMQEVCLFNACGFFKDVYAGD